jgi:Ca2+-binding RTX toxin-like protein
VSLPGNNNTVVLGGGNDTVSLPGSNNTATLGDGNDNVMAGAGNTIMLGKGNDTVYAGASDTITLGNGNDLVLFGVSPSPSILDSEIVNGFNPKNDIIEFNRALFASFTAVLDDATQVGLDTIITRDPNDTVTLHGVALSLLTASNVKIV